MRSVCDVGQSHLLNSGNGARKKTRFAEAIPVQVSLDNELNFLVEQKLLKEK